MCIKNAVRAPEAPFDHQIPGQVPRQERLAVALVPHGDPTRRLLRRQHRSLASSLHLINSYYYIIIRYNTILYYIQI